ncbi:MAG: ferric reductase-like transmembrane domain-containing protein [Actinobacteria bacterium]|nr:ferric reductase-like transmembrane domain-containing protein [Actinomycetota bacterium]
MITWNILRAAGVGAYLTLFAAVALGLAGTTSLGVRKGAKKGTVSLHQFLSTVGLLLLAVHLGGLLVDSYMKFSVPDLLFPFQGAYKPVATAIGIVAMYGMIVILVASWVRRGISNRMWRVTHLLAIPIFSMAMLHGVFAGTDTARPGFWIMYLTTGGIVVFLTILRAFTAREPRAVRKGNTAPSGKVGSGVEQRSTPQIRSDGPLVAVPGPPGDRARSTL